MARSPSKAVLADVRSALGKVLGPGEDLGDAGGLVSGEVDLLLQASDGVFAVEWKPVGDAANVGRAVRQLGSVKKARAGRSMPLTPLLAVPYMGETGRRLCAEASLSWIDLSGNAWIDAPGRQVHILGHRNGFLSPGRPADVFAPRSSRVIRALLMEPERSFTQSELVEVSGVDKGRVSRLVKRLEAMGLVARVDSRSLRIKEPALALDAWREAYDFERHDIVRGHVAVRDPGELVQRIAESSAPSGPWALTGLAAAWQLTHFAMFRLVTILVAHRPSADWLSAIGFREEARGANLWIVRPVDDAVFDGATAVEGVPCAHPLQVFLDLEAHPERAKGAAEELRKRYLDRSPA